MTETAHRQLLAGVREHAVACNAEGRESVLADVVARIDGLGEPTSVEARSLPVVDEWLETAMAATISSTQPLVELLRRHRGSLHWAIPYGDVTDNPDIDHMRTRYAYGLLAGSASRGSATGSNSSADHKMPSEFASSSSLKKPACPPVTRMRGRPATRHS